jgi:hypothetical protein
MKAMIMHQEPTRRSESRVYGRSRSSSSKNVVKISTSSGSTKALRSRQNSMQEVSLLSFLRSSCSLSGR